MREILHHLRDTYIYIYMCYTSRIPMVLVYEVYIWSCRMSTINVDGRNPAWPYIDLIYQKYRNSASMLHIYI